MPKPLLYGLIVGFFVTMLILAVISIVVPGHFVYVGVPATATPVATPMDVIFRLRSADGKSDQEWLCKYEARQGWLCQVRE